MHLRLPIAAVDERYRELYGIVPHIPGYVGESMRVLELNRKRERGHPGRIFVARDLKCRREILRYRTQQCIDIHRANQAECGYASRIT